MRTNIDIWAVGFMTVVVLAGSLVQDRPVRPVVLRGFGPDVGWNAAQVEAVAEEAICEASQELARQLGI